MIQSSWLQETVHTYRLVPGHGENAHKYTQHLHNCCIYVQLAWLLPRELMLCRLTSSRKFSISCREREREREKERERERVRRFGIESWCKQHSGVELPTMQDDTYKWQQKHHRCSLSLCHTSYVRTYIHT